MVVFGSAPLPLQSWGLLSNPITTLPESTFVSLASLKPIHPNLVPVLSRTLSTLTEGPQVVLRLLNHLQRALRCFPCRRSWEKTPEPPLFFSTLLLFLHGKTFTPHSTFSNSSLIYHIPATISPPSLPQVSPSHLSSHPDLPSLPPSPLRKGQAFQGHRPYMV